MYTLEEVTKEIPDTDKIELVGVKIMVGQQMVAALNGGLAAMVTTAHANLSRQTYGSQRADAFLFGIVTALNHCTLTGSIPSVTDGN